MRTDRRTVRHVKAYWRFSTTRWTCLKIGPVKYEAYSSKLRKNFLQRANFNSEKSILHDRRQLTMTHLEFSKLQCWGSRHHLTEYMLETRRWAVLMFEATYGDERQREREREFSGRQLPLVALYNFSARCTQHCSSHNMRLAQNFTREIPPCMHISDRKSSQTWNKNAGAWSYFHIKSDLVSWIIFQIKSNEDARFLLSH
jgi:hypothetical protein